MRSDCSAPANPKAAGEIECIKKKKNVPVFSPKNNKN